MIEYRAVGICDGPRKLCENTCTARTNIILMKNSPSGCDVWVNFEVDEGWGMRGSFTASIFCSECLKKYDEMHTRLFGKEY